MREGVGVEEVWLKGSIGVRICCPETIIGQLRAGRQAAASENTQNLHGK